jgi:hypothetical protein
MTPALAAVPDGPDGDPRPNAPRSIQGEALNARRDQYYADRGFVDQYARECSDGVAICRERFRHRYPPIPKRQPFDNDTSPTGYLIRRTDPCLDCGCAYQVQRYVAFYEGKGKNRRLRVEPAYNSTQYIENEHGEWYPTRDHGFVRPKDFRGAIITMAVNADPETQAQAVAALKLREQWTARRDAAAAAREQAREQEAT